MKKILIIKSDQKESNLLYLIKGLNYDKLKIFTSDKNLIKSIPNNVKSFYRKSIPAPKTFGDYFFFTLVAPFITLFLLIRLITNKIQKFNVLILTSLTEKILITPYAKLLGYKVIWLESDFLDNTFRINIYSVIYSLFSKLAIVVPFSLSVKNNLIKQYNIKEKNIKLINQPIDINEIKIQTDIYHDMANKDYQIQNKALFVIGFIGDLNQDDGAEYLIKSIEYFKEMIPSFQIIIVGDGKEKKNLIWITKMLGYDKNIRFVGKQDNITRWYNYFDLLVYPRTKKINFSTIVAQAMATGTPIVSTKIDGIEEIVNHQGGILVDPANAKQLADAIFQIYNDVNLRMQFGKQAKNRIEKFYSITSMLDGFNNL